MSYSQCLDLADTGSGSAQYPPKAPGPRDWPMLSQWLRVNENVSPAAALAVVVVQSLSRVQLFATPWTAACQSSLSFTISWNLLKLMSIESVMPSNHCIFCCPLLPLPSIFPCIRAFSNAAALAPPKRTRSYGKLSLGIQSHYHNFYYHVPWFQKTQFSKVILVLLWKENYGIIQWFVVLVSAHC